MLWLIKPSAANALQVHAIDLEQSLGPNENAQAGFDGNISRFIRSVCHVNKACKKLREVSIPYVYEEVIFPLGTYIPDKSRETSEQCIPTILGYIQAHTRVLTVNGSSADGAQAVLGDILLALPGAQKLHSLWFDGKSYMDHWNYVYLDTAFNGPKSNSLRATLSNMSLPWYKQDEIWAHDTVDCTMYFEFSSTNLDNDRIIKVDASGKPSLNGDDQRSKEGVPRKLLRNLFRVWGIGKGFEVLHIEDMLEEAYYGFVLDLCMFPGVTQHAKMSVAAISFARVAFSLPFLNCLQAAINATSIRSVDLFECFNLDFPLSWLLQSAHSLNIKEFSCENWVHQPDQQQHRLPTGLLTTFLDCFHGLEKCELIDSASSPVNLEALMSNHADTLRHLVFDAGGLPIYADGLTHLAQLCPNLHTLGFRNGVFALPFQQGQFSASPEWHSGDVGGFDHHVIEIADALVDFEQLECVEIFFAAVPHIHLKYDYDWWPADTREWYWTAEELNRDYGAYSVLSKRIMCHLDLAMARKTDGVVCVSNVNKIVLMDRPFPGDVDDGEGTLEEIRNAHRWTYDFSNRANPAVLGELVEAEGD